MQGKADVVRLNVHEPVAEPFMQRYDFQFTPTFVLLDSEGNEVWRMMGILNREAALEQINALD